MWTLLRAAFAWAALAAVAFAQPPSIDEFVNDEGFYGAALSPSGRYVAGIRRQADREMLLIYDLADRQARVLEQMPRSGDAGFNWVAWKTDDRLIVAASIMIGYGSRTPTGSHIQSHRAGEFPVTRVFALNRNGGGVVQLFEGQMHRLAARFVSTFLVDRLRDDPDHVLVAAYRQQGLALWRANVASGRVELVDSGNMDTFGWETDRTGAAILRMENLSRAAGYRILRRAPGARDWTPHIEVRGGEEGNLPGFEALSPGPNPGEAYVQALPDGQDRSGLYVFNAATGALSEPLYHHPVGDFVGAWVDPATRALLAGCGYNQRRECQAFDADFGRHLRAVEAFFEGHAEVAPVEISEDGNVWLLRVHAPTAPPSYYIYDRALRSVSFLDGRGLALTEDRLSPTDIISYRTRDGVNLWAYLTVPRTAPAAGAPLIVMPHGGPEARDTYGYDMLVQFLASRGYLVLQPQFRGSSGFGRAFAEAGRRQWGRRMQDDVTDAIAHLTQSGRVDPARICIAGISYGGYAALAGAALTPDLYRCAISINGVGDLREMLRHERAEEGRRSATLDYWRRSIGDETAERADIDAVSPRQQAAAIRIPILLVAGQDDSIVPVRQSELMQDALRDAGKSVRFVRMPDSGHSPSAWKIERQQQLLRELETFLNANLPAH